MDDSHIEYYLMEIRHQGQLMSVAVEDLNHQINQGRDISHARAFAAAQAMLTSAAQLSKMFWAGTDRRWTEERTKFAVHRAKTLRDMLNPPEILSGRTVRNSVEHLDARFDDLMYENPDANIVDNLIGRRDIFKGDNMVLMRALDPTVLEYSALDDSVSLQAIYDASMQVVRAANESLERRRGFSLPTRNDPLPGR